MKRGIIYAHLALLAVNLIYGANYVIAKGVMPEYLNPATFIMARVTGALLLFWIVNRFVGLDKVKGKDFIRLAFCGLFGVAVNQLFFFEGLNLTSPVNAAIIMTSTPIMVVLISWPILGDRISLKKLLGIGLGLSGALGVILSGGNAAGISPTGDSFILINAMSYALYLVLVKPLMSKYSPITVISYVFAFGCAFVVPYSYDSFAGQDWALPTGVLLRVGFVVFFVTFIAYLLNIFALKIVSPTVSSSYIYLQPLLSTLFALMHDSMYGSSMVSGLTVFHLLFGLMICSGVYIVSRASLKNR